MKQFRFCPFSFSLAGVFVLMLVFSLASAQSSLVFPPGLEPECPIDCGSLVDAGITELKVEYSDGGEKYTRNLCRLSGKGEVLENSVFLPDGALKYRKEYFWEKGRLTGVMTIDNGGNQYVDYLTWEKKQVSGTYRQPSETGAQVYFEYDGKDRLVEVRKGKRRSDSKLIRLYRYDDRDQLLLDSAVTSEASHFRYDEEGRVIYENQITYLEDYTMENAVTYTYNSKGLVAEERMGGPGNGGMLHRFKYDGQNRPILEEWLDLEGVMGEKMTFTYSRDGKRTDSKVFHAGSSEKPQAVSFETMNEDGLPLEASLKENGSEAYRWIYHYQK